MLSVSPILPAELVSNSARRDQFLMVYRLSHPPRRTGPQQYEKRSVPQSVHRYWTCKF